MLVIAMIFPITYPASAAVTWSTSSPNDSFNRPDLNSQYDLTYVSATIFDNEVDSIYFYLNFKNVPRINQYNDGSSFAAVLLDYNLDSKIDLEEIFDPS